MPKAKPDGAAPAPDLVPVVLAADGSIRDVPAADVQALIDSGEALRAATARDLAIGR